VSDIIIEPANPLDLRPEDLAGLATALRGIDPPVDVRIGYREQRGYGVTWWEVLFIWVGKEVADNLLKEVTRVGVEWARSRFDFSTKAKRPISITILGPDGKPLKKVKVDPKTREAEDEAPDSSDIPRVQPPIRE
jgi:hypothetical protein